MAAYLVYHVIVLLVDIKLWGRWLASVVTSHCSMIYCDVRNCLFFSLLACLPKTWMSNGFFVRCILIIHQRVVDWNIDCAIFCSSQCWCFKYLFCCKDRSSYFGARFSHWYITDFYIIRLCLIENWRLIHHDWVELFICACHVLLIHDYGICCGVIIYINSCVTSKISRYIWAQARNVLTWWPYFLRWWACRLVKYILLMWSILCCWEFRWGSFLHHNRFVDCVQFSCFPFPFFLDWLLWHHSLAMLGTKVWMTKVNWRCWI